MNQDKPNLVIVDDEKLVLNSFRRMLEDERWNTEGFENGRSASDYVLENLDSTFCGITDCDMPEMNGIEMTRMIREAENGTHIPIIMATGIYSTEREVEAKKAGVDNILAKPFNPDNLLVLVEKAYEHYCKPFAVVVGDSDSSISDYRSLFNGGSNKVVYFSRPSEALGFVQKNPSRVYLVVTDHNLNGMDGLELTREVKGLEGKKPIVYLASDQESMRETALAEGIDFFMQKPLKYADLLKSMITAAHSKWSKGQTNL